MASPNYDDEVLPVLLECGHTKNLLAGHNHTNTWSIPYKGIRMTFATKIGKGCYWDPEINGGTVITLDERGVKELRHEYVDLSQWTIENGQWTISVCAAKRRVFFVWGKRTGRGSLL